MILNEIVAAIDPDIAKNYPDKSIKAKYRLSVIVQKMRDDIASMKEEAKDLRRKIELLRKRAKHFFVDTEYWQDRFDKEQTRTTRKNLKKASRREQAAWAEVKKVKEELDTLVQDIEHREYDLESILKTFKNPM